MSDNGNVYGRIEGHLHSPPSDVESKILGSLLLEPSSLDRIGGSLQDSDFSGEWASLVYRTLNTVFSVGCPHEAIPGAVVRELVKTTGRTVADVDRDIMAFMESVVVLSTIDHDVRALTEQATSRRVRIEAQRLQSFAAAGDLAAARESIRVLGDLSLGGVSAEVTTLTDAAHRHADRLERLEGDSPPRFTTGLRVFDGLINQATSGGLQGGQLGLIGGRTSSGKTTLASFVACQVAARHPEARVHIFSLELDPRVLASKAAAREIATSYVKGPVIKGSESEKARAAADRIGEGIGQRITISEEVRPDRILATAHRLARDGVNLFVLDHVHRVKVHNLANIRHEIGDFGIACRDHAKRWDVPWIMAAQLNRDSVKALTAPGLKDVAESDKLTHEADWAIAIWYPDMSDRSKCELRIVKNRTGPEVSCRVGVNWSAQSYYELGGDDG